MGEVSNCGVPPRSGWFAPAYSTVRDVCGALLVALLFFMLPTHTAANPATASDPRESVDFEFVSGGKTLSGVLDQPATGEAQALVVFVHGYGSTDVRARPPFNTLRRRLAENGIASLVWDKPGQGRSEGSFDAGQPVESSAQEVVDAVKQLRLRRVPGAQRIGLWGISRAGWIAPLAMAQDPSIKFWISVSGVDDQENFRYLLESNLRIEGRSEDQVRALSAEWMRGFEIRSRGGSFLDYLAATEQLRRDPFIVRLEGSNPPSEAGFIRNQQSYLSGATQVHPRTGLQIYVPDFEKVLGNLNADVLAIFGERDANVDWRRTKALYEATIGNNPKATLTVRTFPGANHNLHQSVTGGLKEAQDMQKPTHPEDYYETQMEWLRAHVLAKPRQR